jgi:hypothetical protein
VDLDVDWKTVDGDRLQVVDVDVERRITNKLKTVSEQSVLSLRRVGDEQIDVTEDS